MELTKLVTQHYSRQGLWSLFLMCAFPLHAWALLLAFRDLSWLTERTNAWDAIGVGAYGLVFAFIESVVIFLVIVLLGFLVSRRWDEERRIALLSVLALVLALWAIIGQLFFMLAVSVPGGVIGFMAGTAHPLRLLYAAALALVAPTVLVPTLLVLRSGRASQLIRGLIERVSLLTMFYLLFDVIGLVIVLIRNIS